MPGRITRIISNLYTVNIDGVEYLCNARGKFRNDKITPIVGDFCEIDISNKYILDILPRKNELKRPTIANVDVALIVTSVKKPDLSLNLLDKMITTVLINNVEPIICLTKLDLMTRSDKKEIKNLIKYYKSIGFKVVDNKNLFKLKRTIKNKLVVLAGQTGAGKSALLNKLNKKLNLNTNPISEALGRGIHTTRHVELFEFGSCLIADTPGFSSIEFKTNTTEEIKNTFIEFKNYTCPFKDCNHIGEHECAVKDAVDNNKILKSRYKNYVSFVNEVKK